MNGKCGKFIMGAVVLLVMSSTSFSGENTRVVRSIVFPGMGQLGDGQTGRGLLYLSGEAALLTLTFSNVAKHASFVRKTQYDSVAIYDEGGFAEARKEIIDQWQANVDNAAKAKTMSLAFAGASAVWWVWNVVDGMLFAPRESASHHRYRKIKNNTVVAIGLDNASVEYTLDF